MSDQRGSKNHNWRGGKQSHPLYFVYHEMVGRCERPTHARYKDYGARGIGVCERWRSDFWAFVNDMGPKPERYVLDRIDNDGDYGPDNCRWTTYSVSNFNRRRPPTRALHGTDSRYVRGCRCDECRAAHADYHRRYTQRKKEMAV